MEIRPHSMGIKLLGIIENRLETVRGFNNLLIDLVV